MMKLVIGRAIEEACSDFAEQCGQAVEQAQVQKANCSGQEKEEQQVGVSKEHLKAWMNSLEDEAAWLDRRAGSLFERRNQVAIKIGQVKGLMK